MDNKNQAVKVMDEAQLDDKFGLNNPETTLTSAEIDLLDESGIINLVGDIIKEVVDDVRENALNPNQIEAAALVAMGLNDAEIATLVGVTRKTVNLWKNHNVFFMEEVERKRGEIWETYKVQYRILVPRAIDAMGNALDHGNENMRMKAAMYILRSLKLE